MAVLTHAALAVSSGIAIFVKTPALSPVKTRLWPGLGQQCAVALYLISAEAVASVAKAARQQVDLQAYWAVAEAEAIHGDAWLELPHLPQGEGGLGQRMAQVYRMLRTHHRGAILIGADTPQLEPAALERAARWLASTEPRLVIGRAEDGGFWLFGGNVDVPHQAWLAPRYSTADTASEFIAALGSTGHWMQLETLRDIDTVEDLPGVHTDLSALSAPTAEQLRLREWLRGLPLALGASA